MSDTSEIKKKSVLEPEKILSSSDSKLKDETNDSEKEKGRAVSDQENEISNEIKLNESLSKAEAESKNNFELMLRAKAELENYKKRTVREMNDVRKYAKESLMKDMLTVVDNLERAIESSNNNVEGTLEGVKLTLNEMVKVLRKHDVIPIESMGAIFNPKIHQAMSQEETSDHPKDTVIKEFLKGYLLHDRLLRPAMVVVSKKPEKDNS